MKIPPAVDGSRYSEAAVGLVKALRIGRKAEVIVLTVIPKQVWIKGKFVAPLPGRNDLRSWILLQFLKEVNTQSDVKLA
jgi:nucleotide-binding universal stress UspA family protein